ncbi:MAG: hypothetical protein COX30_04545 [Candidatus Moranbacteria bacterium CG23_combo_of_CG06-09_8_20_14_all_39_10]|nr:MAG: hypothetical protein COX30_04545 [Candidatus Moranbacteria bacterium CG23_combo_of_CG06-09_8_20_14_all_39_10]
MGLFNVPQFIDIEDKIVGPLTAKQLGWMAAAGTIMLVMWSLLDMATFIVASIFVGLVFGALAFYKPNGQPLIFFIMSIFAYFLKPKMYIWRRISDGQNSTKPTQKKNATIKTAPTKEISESKIEAISHLLDSN